jgi:hypothetical protein
MILALYLLMLGQDVTPVMLVTTSIEKCYDCSFTNAVYCEGGCPPPTKTVAHVRNFKTAVEAIKWLNENLNPRPDSFTIPSTWSVAGTRVNEEVVGLYYVRQIPTAKVDTGEEVDTEKVETKVVKKRLPVQKWAIKP